MGTRGSALSVRAGLFHVREAMKPRDSEKKKHRPLSEDVGPEDGVDPKRFFGGTSRKKTNRKALQLCSQVEQTLSAILSWESGSELLRSLVVESVEPAPDSTRVLVSVSVTDARPCSPAEVLACLHRSAAWLRTEVAAAIHRKRVPQLVFRMVGDKGVKR
jgi:ribosome-binding factor A